MGRILDGKDSSDSGELRVLLLLEIMVKIRKDQKRIESCYDQVLSGFDTSIVHCAIRSFIASTYDLLGATNV